MRGDQFYDMAKEANLDIQQLKPTEQKACTYYQKPIITLDGQIDVKITFGDKTVVRKVFIKLVAPDKLLLPENVCQMIEIVSYHPDVQAVGNSESDSIVDALAVNKSGAVEPTTDIVVEEPAIDGSKPKLKDGQTMNREVDASPVAVVKLLSAVRFPACHFAVVPAQVNIRFCANKTMQTKWAYR